MRNARGSYELASPGSPGTTQRDKCFPWVGYYSRRRFVMRKKLPNVLAASLLAGALAIAGASPAVAQTKVAEGGSMSMPKVGDVAPDFTLKYFDGNELKSVSLSQYRGKKNVVLGFFIFAFTGG